MQPTASQVGNMSSRAQTTTSQSAPATTHVIQRGQYQLEPAAVPFPHPVSRLDTNQNQNIFPTLTTALSNLQDHTVERLDKLESSMQNVLETLTGIKKQTCSETDRLAQWLERSHILQIKATQCVFSRVEELRSLIGNAPPADQNAALTGRLERTECILRELLESVNVRDIAHLDEGIDPIHLDPVYVPQIGNVGFNSRRSAYVDVGVGVYGPQLSDSGETSPKRSGPQQHWRSAFDSPIDVSPKMPSNVRGTVKVDGWGKRASRRTLVPPNVAGLSKPEARRLKHRTSAFLSRQRKRDAFESMETRVAQLVEENAQLLALVRNPGQLPQKEHHDKSQLCAERLPEQQMALVELSIDAHTPTSTGALQATVDSCAPSHGSTTADADEAEHACFDDFPRIPEHASCSPLVPPLFQQAVSLQSRFPSSPFHSDPMVPATWSRHEDSSSDSPDSSSLESPASQLSYVQVLTDITHDTITTTKDEIPAVHPESSLDDPNVFGLLGQECYNESLSQNDGRHAWQRRSSTSAEPLLSGTTPAGCQSGPVSAPSRIPSAHGPPSPFNRSSGLPSSSTSHITIAPLSLPITSSSTAVGSSHPGSLHSSSPCDTKAVAPAGSSPVRIPLPGNLRATSLRGRTGSLSSMSSLTPSDSGVRELTRLQFQDQLAISERQSSSGIQIIENHSSSTGRRGGRGRQRGENEGRPRKRRKTEGDLLGIRNINSLSPKRRGRSRKTPGAVSAHNTMGDTSLAEVITRVDDALVCNWPEKINGDATYQREFVQCDNCDAWYHFGCVGLTTGDPRLEANAEFICPVCEVSQEQRMSQVSSLSALSILSPIILT
ncbi:hypothetical protein AcV7_002641 [Taiwanofungus camphoratus]|nr:hypothetical protein AcV7_002641 [Antrodia cinnamomea]